MATEDHNLLERIISGANRMFANAVEYFSPNYIRSKKEHCDGDITENSLFFDKAQCHGVQESFCEHYPEECPDHGLGSTGQSSGVSIKK